jgi:pimeloyl-ACP methyl ester carboxylesterase
MERDEEGPRRSENPGTVVSGALPRLEPLRYVRTDALEVAYFEAGPSDGEVVLLLHGFPYDIHSYVDVIPRLVEAGHRVIAPISAGMDPPASWTAPPRDRDSKRPSAAT